MVTQGAIPRSPAQRLQLSLCIFGIFNLRVASLRCHVLYMAAAHGSQFKHSKVRGITVGRTSITGRRWVVVGAYDIFVYFMYESSGVWRGCHA